eukprot:SAG22_NODE_6747_length_816_cov_1.863319_1_plen_272_part_11
MKQTQPVVCRQYGLSTGCWQVTVCFGDGPNDPCSYQAPVGVVRCADFILWRLPYVPTGAAGGGGCRRAYCTTQSGTASGRRLQVNQADNITRMKSDDDMALDFTSVVVTDFSDPGQVKQLFRAMMTELLNMSLAKAELVRELEAERKDKEALWMRVMELESRTKKDTRRINARLDQCEADTFTKVVERRQMQEKTPACDREAVDDMLAVCCAAPAGKGHRLQEYVGCDFLPPTCSIHCSLQFNNSIFENCHDHGLMQGLSAEQLADWTSFYA